MSQVPFRRVVIKRDPDSPLHYLACRNPCAPDQWCMRDAHGRPQCYLGGSFTEAGARVIAERCGYEVADE